MTEHTEHGDVATEKNTVVTCSGVSKSFTRKANKVEALRDVSLQLQAGELVTIRGKSGCGKSTLMLCMGGLQRPDSGTVHVSGQDLYSLPADERARFRGQHIGYVFQQFHLIPYLTVEENIRAARLGLTSDAGSRTDEKQDAQKLIEQVGLSHRSDHNPSELSIGECQRAAIARALMNSPALILADEPTGNLDEENTESILNAFREIANQGTSVAIVTHDTQCDSFADRVLHIADGKLV